MRYCCEAQKIAVFFLYSFFSLIIMKGNNLINFIIALQFWPFLFSGKKATNKNKNIGGRGGNNHYCPKGEVPYKKIYGKW